MQKCGACGAALKPCWTSWFCPNECDLKPPKRVASARFAWCAAKELPGSVSGRVIGWFGKINAELCAGQLNAAARSYASYTLHTIEYILQCEFGWVVYDTQENHP